MTKVVKTTKKKKVKIVLPEVQEYIIQSNTVTNAINDFTLYQERVLTAIIYRLQEPITLDQNGKNYKQLSLFDNNSIILDIPLKEISLPRQYDKVKRAIKAMATSEVSFSYFDEKGRPMEYTSGLFSATMPTKGNGGGQITVKFEPIVANLLVSIQKDAKGNPIHYTKFMYQIAQSVRSPYTSKLYKLISSWKKKGGFYITRDKLYKFLGVKEGEYESNSDFMRRIIKPAHEELYEQSDCWFNMKAKDFVKREKDSPRGKVLGFNFKVITPELGEIEDKKIEQIINVLRDHFKCNEDDIQEIKFIFDEDTFIYEQVMGKVLELAEKIENDKSIAHKNRYVVSSLLNEFGK